MTEKDLLERIAILERRIKHLERQMPRVNAIGKPLDPNSKVHIPVVEE